MTDMSKVIIAKSDQLNSDDLVSGPITVTIRDVSIRDSTEQPVSIFYDGDKGKPYKCCKSMARVLVHAWGADAKNYIGRSMTLYRDPTVKWAGMAVGGIRISHLSHIEREMTVPLTETKGQKKLFKVLPLKDAPGSRQQTDDQATTKQPGTISFTSPIGEAREFQRNMGGMEQYVEAFAAAFAEATDKAAWFDQNKALFHELAVGATGSRGKSERCEKLAARFDAVATMIGETLTVPVTTADAAAEPTVSKLTVPEIDGRPHWRGFRDEAVAALTAMTPEQRMAWAAMHADEMAGLLAASKKFHGEVENALAGGAA